MFSLLLAAVTMVTDTTVTSTHGSKSMQLGRDWVTFDLRVKADMLKCKTFEISVGDLKVDGQLYVWTGSLTCHR